MGFSFGFTEDDLEGTAPVDASAELALATRALDNFAVAPANAPQAHELIAVLNLLVDTKVSFEKFTTEGGNVVYRRELFDVRHQVMSEDDATTVTELLLLQDGDLEKNVYEGGFKLWECSYDGIDYLARGVHWDTVCDLGCGTSLPLCYLLTQALAAAKPGTVVLSDFNYEVLRLVSVPNLVINWAVHRGKPEGNELLLTNEVIAEFMGDLERGGIRVQLISGSWGKQFLGMLPPIDLLLTSETIYHEETLPLVAEMVVAIRPRLALVAAKNIYFGVGGSIIEFVRYFKSISHAPLTQHEIGSSQLKRSIVAIEH